LQRVHELAAAGSVRLTGKALRELYSLGAGLAPDDVCEVLLRLKAADCAGRLVSAVTGEWMYVFKPAFDDTIIYVKLVVRSECVVVSFHEDEDSHHEEDN
jgi:hypothetical protein